MTIETLKTHLREALAVIARYASPVAYRNHVLALLLIKRINDQIAARSRVLEQAALQAGRSPQEARALANDPDEHRWLLPASARWENLMAATNGLGAALENACMDLERHNPKRLTAVLSPLRFEGIGIPAEAEQHEAMFREVLAQLDKLDSGAATAQLFGDAVEFLIEALAEWANKKQTNNTSAKPLMQLLAELLRPEPNMRVCDPACGAGGAFLACTEYVQQQGHAPQTLSFYGQEFDTETWRACKLNLLLHDLLDVRIVRGSSISQPILDEAGRLLQFDLVLAEPPFSLAEWEHEAAARTAHGRFDAGLPPPHRGEFAFVQHIAATLNERGRAAIVVPHGVLFRGGMEKQIRASMLQPETDLIEAVIALPEGALGNHKMPSAILILNRNKAETRRERVLFINANALLRSTRAIPLEVATRREIAALYHNFDKANDAAGAGVARMISLHEIATKHDFSLHVARYVAAAPDTFSLDIAQTLAELEPLERDRLAAETAMTRMLRELGYE